MASEVEKIIDNWGRKFEPATGSRGQGGLSLPGSVTDWKLTITKDGWNFYKQELVQALTTYIDSVVEQKVLEGRLVELDLFEQFLNRHAHKQGMFVDYKLQRLKDLEERLETLRHRYEQMKGKK